ncbi:hypothetical protein [Chroococcidiopsis sp. CCMEE 29]|nr:hypothetical protein [Chroococcidiopsis sp. CCMEE 29]
MPIRAAAEAVEQVGKTISRLQITIKGPLDIAQPIRRLLTSECTAR